LGGLLFVGMGALVLGVSPVIEFNGPLVHYEIDIDFWVGVSHGGDSSSSSGGGGGGEW